VEYFIENNQVTHHSHKVLEWVRLILNWISQEADFYEDEELYEGLGLKNIQMGSSLLSSADDEEEDLSDSGSGMEHFTTIFLLLKSYSNDTNHRGLGQS